jgi:hypothetical protein
MPHRLDRVGRPACNRFKSHTCREAQPVYFPQPPTSSTTTHNNNIVIGTIFEGCEVLALQATLIEVTLIVELGEHVTVEFETDAHEALDRSHRR